MTRIVIPAGVMSAFAGVLAFGARDSLLPATPVRVVPVMEVAGVDGAAASGAAIVQAPGWIEGDPYSYAASALVEGVVRDVLVLEGERVEAGQPVAQLIDDDAKLALAAAEARAQETIAELASAVAAREAAQRTWDHPVELDRAVEAADAMLAERRAELAQHPADVAVEEARAAELEAEYTRLKALAEREQTSEIELIRARRQYEAQAAKAQSMRDHLAILEAQAARARAELQAARENRRLRIAETRALAEALSAEQGARAAVHRAEAERDLAKLNLERTEVRAPIAGVVMSRLVEPGSKIMLRSDMPRSAQVVRLYDPGKLQVRVDVPLSDAAHVGVDQHAEVVVQVLPDRVFHGRVTRVVHEADLQKNTLQVKVAVESPTPEIKPEMLARVRFLAPPQSSTAPAGRYRLMAPAANVGKPVEGPAFVWLAAGEVVERRVVTLGTARRGEWIEVTDGLRPGDRIIVSPAEGLRSGERIRIIGESTLGEDAR